MVLFKQCITMGLDILFPPRCFSCGEMVGEHGNICGECWSGVDFISAPLCRCCGMPFELDTAEGEECMPCLQSPPPYAAARAVFRYEGDSRRLITGYKYYDRTLASPMFARWMARAGAELLAQAEVIVPVPLHRRRLVQRRYNQSALLALALGKATQKPVLVDALKRTRHTPQQAGLTREQRQENVKDAFAVNTRHKDMLSDKAVLLVDDVLTTGATLNACTQALLERGAKAVYVLTVARTTLDDV
jgi:ComF family protein